MKTLNQFLFICFIVLLVMTVVKLAYLINISTIPFDTDESDHANAAIEVYQSIKNGSLPEILYAFTRQAFYPPLHSVFTAVGYFIAGPSWSSSRMPSLLFYILTVPLLGAAVFNLTKDSFAALVASVGLVTSKITLLHSALSMLELCGVFTISLSIYLLTLRRFYLIYFILGCVLIFLVKYSFAIMVIPGLFCIFLIPNQKPYINLRGMLAGIFVTALCAAWVFFSSYHSFISFLTGHPSYAPLLSSDNIFFEIRSWIIDYNANPIVSVLYFVLAFFGARNISYLAVRAADGIVFFSVFILMLSTTNETRHFMAAAPALFFLAGIGAASAKRNVKYLSSATIVLALIFHSYNLMHIEGEILKEMEGVPEYGRLQEFMIASVEPGKPVLIIGSSDEFSMEGMQWLAAATWKQLYSKIEFDQFPFRADKDITAQRRKRNRDYPFENLDYPKTPLHSVIDGGHYKYIVTIRKIGARDAVFETVKEAKALLSGKPEMSKTLADREVTIYRLT